MPETRTNSNVEEFWIDPRKYTSFSIPWHKFEETEIQAIIKLFYERKGYEIHWRHAEDRAHEEGADLVCHKNGRKLAIAVKIKPLKKDLYQLFELHSLDSDGKIYVYSGEAAVIFEKEKTRYPDITFWTFADLQQNLLSQTFKIGFELIMDNTAFTIECLRLFHKIRNFVTSEETFKETPAFLSFLKKRLISHLWDIKDRISVLHKGTKVLQAILESGALPQDINYQKIIALISVGLNFLFKDSLQQFTRNMDLILTEYRPLLVESYLRTRGRSNWRIFQDLPPFDFLHSFQPGAVTEKCLLIQQQDKSFKDVTEENTNSEKCSLQVIATNRIRLIGNFFGDVEKIIDDLFDVAKA